MLDNVCDVCLAFGRVVNTRQEPILNGRVCVSVSLLHRSGRLCNATGCHLVSNVFTHPVKPVAAVGHVELAICNLMHVGFGLAI